MRVCETDAQRAEEQGHVLPLVTAGGAGGAGESNAVMGGNGEQEGVGAVGWRKGKTVKAATMFASILKRQVAVAAAAAAAATTEAQPDFPVTTVFTLERKKDGAKEELKHYEAEAPLPGDASPHDVLDWWFAHKNILPSLYRVACVYLTIPATSSATKRVFATSENIMTLKRNSLGGEAVDALVFLHGCEGVGWKATVRDNT